MERSRARRIIIWSAAVLYNARAARLLRPKKQGHSPWSAPGRIKKSGTRRRQLLAGDCSQRRTRWNEDWPLVMAIGDLSQPKKPGPDDTR